MKLKAENLEQYCAKIQLGFFERMVSNDTIKKKLEEAGLTQVRVTGSGSERIAYAKYIGEDKTFDLPSQVKEVKKVS